MLNSYSSCHYFLAKVMTIYVVVTLQVIQELLNVYKQLCIDYIILCHFMLKALASRNFDSHRVQEAKKPACLGC